jgi:hypothetical protein
MCRKEKKRKEKKRTIRICKKEFNMDEHFPITICINEKKCIRRVPRIATYKTKKIDHEHFYNHNLEKKIHQGSTFCNHNM